MKRRVLMIVLPSKDCSDYEMAMPIGSISTSKIVDTSDRDCEELLEHMAGYLAWEIRQREERK